MPDYAANALERSALHTTEHTRRAPIYLDYNATTPVEPAVIRAVSAALRDDFGNPSSDHAYGYRAREAVRQARASLAALVDAQPDEVIFTSGGSEANNAAIKGLADALRRRGDTRNHIITSAVEHPAITAPLEWLRRAGYEITTVPVDRDGRVRMDLLAEALTPRTFLVTVMRANNEVGVLQPIAEIAQLAHSHGALMHTDAAQAIGKLPVAMTDLGVDLLSVAGHKFGAPKGVGALIARADVPLEPLIHGAGHEGGRRAGTENTPYAVGLGVAARLASERLPLYNSRVRALRDLLQARLLRLRPDAEVNGGNAERLPNTLNIGFPGVNAGALLAAIRDEVACSTGSACHSGHAEPSPTLLAMSRSPEMASAALRLSLGWRTTRRDVLAAVESIGRALASL